MRRYKLNKEIKLYCKKFGINIHTDSLHIKSTYKTTKGGIKPP